MDKLKPCPFCGGNKIAHSTYYDFNGEGRATEFHTIECMNGSCFAKPSVRYEGKRWRAVDIWNRRKDTP